LQLPYVIPALVDPKICAEGRKDLFEWVTRHIDKHSDQSGLLQLVKPISIGLQVYFGFACLLTLFYYLKLTFGRN